MDINLFLKDLDDLFDNRKMDEIEPFLNESLKKAGNDMAAKFTILNEMMGFFRDSSQFDKSLKACRDCLELMKEMDIEGTVDYATALQNIANAHRAAGKLEESLDFYKKVYEIYERNLSSGDYRFASLNNNIALLYQEMGKFDKAVEHLTEALAIIEKLEGAEIEVATTHSNLAASLTELGRIDEAEEHLEKALATYSKDEVKNFHYSAALTAMAAIKVNRKEYDKAIEMYQEALPEIEANMGRGVAYNITLENLREARKLATNAEEASADAVVSAGEETSADAVVSEGEEASTDAESTTTNLHKQLDIDETKQDIMAHLQINENYVKGLDLCRNFYLEYGRKMIHEHFGEYEDKIAVGLVGEGSERFGFDDVYSTDHDMGPGFCMWITEDVFEKIGDELQAEYDKLPTEFMGVKRVETRMAKGRVGVEIIGDFFEKYTGFRQAPDSILQWADIEDFKLATVTNGEIFRDDQGIFAGIRNDFAHMPEQVRRIKLARQLQLMAQTGQANYGRAMARHDYVTAGICIAEFMESTLRCIYLLNGKYSPYYKWSYSGARQLEILPEISDILRAMADMEDQRGAWEDYEYTNLSPNQKDMKAMTMEIIAKLVINELLNQSLISHYSTDFLNDYVCQVAGLDENMDQPESNLNYGENEPESNLNHGENEPESNLNHGENEPESNLNQNENSNKVGASLKKEMENKQNMNRAEIIDEVVKLEFEAFDKVKNEGGRAECQNNWPYFYVMRKSQYLTWTDDMLNCIRNLWLENKNKGWNMITEKYGRMMEYTAPEDYEKLAPYFPEKSDRTRAIVDQIATIQVQWMEEFSQKYPGLAANARDIRSSADEKYNTSYETYLKGELLTYSEELLAMYGKFVVDLYNNGKNLAQMTIENTALLQGYKSLEDAEEKIEA